MEDKISCQMGLGRDAHRSGAVTKTIRIKLCQQKIQSLLWVVQTWVLSLSAMQQNTDICNVHAVRIKKKIIGLFPTPYYVKSISWYLIPYLVAYLFKG